MYKELIITIVIIALVSIGDVVSQKYTEKCVNEMKNELNTLRESIIANPEDEKIDKLSDELINKWKDKQSKLVYYLEHDELEKVTAQLFEIKGDVEIKETAQSVPEIDKCEFILEHIVEKEAFNFKNIF